MKDREKKIIELYRSGYGQAAIAHEVHTNIRTVKKVLNDNNIHIRTQSEANLKAYSVGRKKKHTVTYTEEQEKIVLDCYLNQKRGLNYCKEQAKTTLTVVNKILKDNHIEKRTYAEAAVESNQNRALYKNKEYFDTQSPNMAWILGFLASDGYISKKSNEISIGLSSVDREILERIKKEIEIENPVRDFTSRAGFDYSELRWSCAKHKKELAKYSIVPKKTFILEPPYALNEKYYLDYVRGYFDGDGSVNFIEVNGKKHYTALRWQVCSATPSILEFILDTLESYGVQRVNIQKNYREKSEKPLYSIQYSTNATKQIYNILYSTGSTLYLARKKNHFEEIIQKIENK